MSSKLLRIIPLLLQSLLTFSMHNPLTITNTSTTTSDTSFAYLFLEKKFITFPETKYDTINEQFHNSFGYDIPELLVKETVDNKSVYKVVPKNYLTNHNSLAPLEIQDLCYPQPVKKIVIKTSSQNTTVQNALKDLDALISLAEEKEQLKQNVIEHMLLLQETLAEKNRLIKDIIDVNAKNEKIEKEIALHKQSQQQKAIPNKPKKKNTKKKPAITSAKTNHSAKALVTPVALPKYNPNQNHTHQKLQIIRSIMKSNNVQTIGQLKTKFYKICEQSNVHALCGRINHYCTWQYLSCENNLIINTDDCESNDSDDHSSSD